MKCTRLMFIKYYVGPVVEPLKGKERGIGKMPDIYTWQSPLQCMRK